MSNIEELQRFKGLIYSKRDHHQREIDKININHNDSQLQKDCEHIILMLHAAAIKSYEDVFSEFEDKNIMTEELK